MLSLSQSKRFSGCYRGRTNTSQIIRILFLSSINNLCFINESPPWFTRSSDRTPITEECSPLHSLMVIVSNDSHLKAFRPVSLIDLPQHLQGVLWAKKRVYLQIKWWIPQWLSRWWTAMNPIGYLLDSTVQRQSAHPPVCRLSVSILSLSLSL